MNTLYIHFCVVTVTTGLQILIFKLGMICFISTSCLWRGSNARTNLRHRIFTVGSLSHKLSPTPASLLPSDQSATRVGIFYSPIAPSPEGRSRWVVHVSPSTDFGASNWVKLTLGSSSGDFLRQDSWRALVLAWENLGLETAAVVPAVFIRTRRLGVQ